MPFASEICSYLQNHLIFLHGYIIPIMFCFQTISSLLNTLTSIIMLELYRIKPVFLFLFIYEFWILYPI